MKLAFTVLAVLSTVGQMNAYNLPSVGSGELANTLQGFVDYIPIKDIHKLTKTYLSCDKEFKKVMQLLQSADLKEFLADVEALDEFKKLLNYLQDNGLDAYFLLQQLNESLAKEPVTLSNYSRCKSTHGLRGYVADLDAILPNYLLSNLFEYKVLTSPVFKKFVNEILSPDYANLFTSTFTNPHFQDLLYYAKELKLNAKLFHSYFPTLLVLKVYIQNNF